MTEQPADQAIEYDCCECGRHLVRMVGPMPDPRLCGLCLLVPGWYTIPRIKQLLDRDTP